jgi:hypothetical protein
VIPVLDSVTADGSDWIFSYTGTLAGDQGLINGSELIIFDFAGYVDGSISADGLPILTSVELTSAVPTPPGFTDDPTLPNLVFKWNGGKYHASGGPFPDQDFSGLSAKSIYSGVTLDAFAAVTVTNNGAATGRPAFNFGSVGVPTLLVPEPASWALMILGLLGAGTALRAYRRAGLTLD